MALNEALDMLYRAMRPASYRCIAMAIEISIDLPAFFVAVDSMNRPNPMCGQPSAGVGQGLLGRVLYKLIK